MGSADQIGTLLVSDPLPSTLRPQTTVYQAYYGSSPAQFIADLAARPSHYTDIQAQHIRTLEQGEDIEERELIDLVLHHQRKSLPEFERAKPAPPPKRAPRSFGPPPATRGPAKRLSI